MEIPALSLLHLNRLIKDHINNQFNETFWVLAEISELTRSKAGHAYLDLIQKGQYTDEIVARARATIWAQVFRYLEPYFAQETGIQLKRGMKILVEVSVEFHEIYGFSLNVQDIDPSYSLGELSRRRKEIIGQLTDEGIFSMNKELTMIELPQRLAVISSKTAAGLGDFIHQILLNSSGYRFKLRVFEAIMQGNQAEESILLALDRVFQQAHKWDCVILVRGGGAKADLSCFDTYALAAGLAQFPIPVITGIGHDRDQTICDLVAHTALKTPTAVASFLIDKGLSIESSLMDLEMQLQMASNNLLAYQQKSLLQLFHRFASSSRQRLALHNREWAFLEFRLKKSVDQTFQHELKRSLARINRVGSVFQKLSGRRRLELENLTRHLIHLPGPLFRRAGQLIDRWEQVNRLLGPEKALKRGFSFSHQNGKLIKSIHQIKPGEKLITSVLDGKYESTVENIFPQNVTKNLTEQQGDFQ